MLRFESFFAAESAMLVMAYEVWPICGDGLDMEIRLTSRSTRPCTLLLRCHSCLRFRFRDSHAIDSAVTVGIHEASACSHSIPDGPELLLAYIKSTSSEAEPYCSPPVYNNQEKGTARRLR